MSEVPKAAAAAGHAQAHRAGAAPGAAVVGIVSDLVGLLHRGAAEDVFAARLAQAEALPGTLAEKSGVVETVRMAMAVRNRLDLQQQRERGMLALNESAQDLSSRLDLPSLLRAIVSRARNLLGSHLAWLSTYDPEKEEFHVLVADGALLEGTSAMVARRRDGVAGVVMATRMPFTTPDYLHDDRFAHSVALDATFRGEGIVALVGVPLIWNDDVIGLLFVADRYHRTHTALSISIVSTLATHAAVALKNARAFEQATSALQEARAARAELERHVHGMKTAAEAHERMTSLLAKGASLSTLCQSIAQSLGGSVIVVDEAAQVIGRGTAPGYVGAQAHAYAPHGERSASIAAAIQQSRRLGRSVPAYEADGETCRVVAVFGGDHVLGSVLLFHAHALDDISLGTFERSASVIGIVLLSQERSEAGRSRDVSILVRSLISLRQDAPSVLSDRAARFGLDLSQPLSLIVVGMDDPEAAYAARRLRAQSPLAGVVLDEVDGTIVIVCASTAARDIERAVTASCRAEFGSGYRGVLSRPVSGPQEIPALHATLRRALAVLARIGVRGRVVGQNEMALYSTLFETHDRASLEGFLEATIGALLSHDVKRGSELASTLLVYFDCSQNAKTAAQRLGIHVNTVRQRLATIEELLGHWGNASRALEIHIALRLWSLGHPDAD